MVRINLIYFLLICSFNIFSLQKPIIKMGVDSYNLFNQFADMVFYPEIVSDTLYIEIKEKFSSVLTVTNTFGSNLRTYNKLLEEIERLRRIKLFNALKFDLKFNQNRFLIISVPSFYYYSSLNKINFYNKIGYSFNTNIFKIVLAYSNYLYLLNQKQHIYHTISFYTYWSTTTKEVKFRTGFCTLFHHYFNKNENENFFPIRKINFMFEVVLDFNKLEFREIFDTIDQDF